MRKNWRVFFILALIASLLVAGCGGGAGTQVKPGGIESKAKDLDAKILKSESRFKKVAEAYKSNPSTETLTGLVDFAAAEKDEFTKLGVQAANLTAGVEEAEAEPATKVMEKIAEAKSLLEELGKAAEASKAALEAPKPDEVKYMDTVTAVKESIKATEEFYAKLAQEEGK